MAGTRYVPARTPWARMLAYSRVVVRRGQAFVSGTLPVDAGGALVGGDDPYLQARQVLRLIEAALAEAGGGLGDVVRLRIYLRDCADLAAVARAQAEAFGPVRPACTVLQCALARAEFRVQMDADALLEEGRPPG